MQCASKFALFLSFPVSVSLEIGEAMVLHAFIDVFDSVGARFHVIQPSEQVHVIGMFGLHVRW